MFIRTVPYTSAIMVRTTIASIPMMAKKASCGAEWHSLLSQSALAPAPSRSGFVPPFLANSPGSGYGTFP